MKKKIIVILTTATVIIGVYTIVVQFDLFGKKPGTDETTIETHVPAQIPEVDTEETEKVKKESTHLTIQQLESVTDARDPFKVAPVVEKEYQAKEKEYQELKGKIEKRIAELEEEKARKEAEGGESYEPVGKPFEETVREEVEKIIKENEKKKPVTSSTKTSEKLTSDAKIVELVSKHSKTYKVDENLVLAIIGNKKASDNKYEIKNPDGTSNRGLMQISTGTAKWLTKLLDMKYKDGMEFDNDTNIKLGTYYLSHLYKQKNDIHYVLTSYYIGPGGAERIKAETGTYESSYSKLILNRMK